MMPDWHHAVSGSGHSKYTKITKKHHMYPTSGSSHISTLGIRTINFRNRMTYDDIGDLE
jgi:hypothetical protein